MKYKVGDEVYAKVKITDSMLDIDGGIERYMYVGNSFWSDTDDIIESPFPTACPFCGGECFVSCLEDGIGIVCDCGYISQLADSEQGAITAHNELCRKVRNV